MTSPDLGTIYRRYIACLNQQDWAHLGQFVSETAQHNGRPFGLAGYRRMLEQDFEQIPDLQFHIELLVADTSRVAARLAFRCTPKATFLGLAINGKTIAFTENVFYEFRDGRIEQVWSVLDKSAIEAQL